MKYLSGAPFSVGGYSEQGRKNYDRIFQRSRPREPETKPCSCGLKSYKGGELRWITCAKHAGKER